MGTAITAALSAAVLYLIEDKRWHSDEAVAHVEALSRDALEALAEKRRLAILPGARFASAAAHAYIVEAGAYVNRWSQWAPRVAYDAHVEAMRLLALESAWGAPL